MQPDPTVLIQLFLNFSILKKKLNLEKKGKNNAMSCFIPLYVYILFIFNFFR